jgi:hypothetical protein
MFKPRALRVFVDDCNLQGASNDDVLKLDCRQAARDNANPAICGENRRNAVMRYRVEATDCHREPGFGCVDRLLICITGGCAPAVTNPLSLRTRHFADAHYAFLALPSGSAVISWPWWP